MFWFELVTGAEPVLAEVLEETEQLDPVLNQPLPQAALRTLLYVEDNPANLSLVEQLVARRPELPW